MDVLFKTNLKKESSFRIEDAGKALSLRKVSTPNYRYMTHRLLGFSPEDYNDMEYDLAETARIIDTESFVAASFRKKRQMILKHGFKLDSKSEKNLEYIQQRLYEIEFITSQTFSDLIAEIVENIVNFNNCFLLKFRKEESSSGLIRELPSGKQFKPIAGLFVLAAPTIDTASHPKTGQIIKYRHRITDKFSKQFKPDDIYHIFENKRVGITIGTPPIEAVKDDILLLRSIEQDTESLIHRHANPFMLIQVGNDNAQARVLGDGSSELDVYAQLIDRMAEDGGAAVPHRVNVKYVGAESQALRLENYLTYFKQRVLAGLCISEVDLGSGGSTVGGSADVASQSLKEDVRTYQKTIENYVTHYIFNELLLESPMYTSANWIPYDERVYFEFIEPDFDKRIKLESHYLQLFQSGLITKESAIRRMDFEIDEMNTDPLLPGDNTNSVRNSVKNNITQPKNQHSSKGTLQVADSLDINHYEAMTNYYTKSFDVFLNILTDYFPQDILHVNREYLLKTFNKLDDIYINYGLEFVNAFVEKSIFSLLDLNT